MTTRSGHVALLSGLSALAVFGCSKTPDVPREWDWSDLSSEPGLYHAVRGAEARSKYGVVESAPKLIMRLAAGFAPNPTDTEEQWQVKQVILQRDDVFRVVWVQRREEKWIVYVWVEISADGRFVESGRHGEVYMQVPLRVPGAMAQQGM